MASAPHSTTAKLAEDLRRIVGRLKRRLRQESHLGDLTWSQLSILSRLERDGPATVTTLARSEGVRPQSMGATVAALQETEHVIAAPDPNDGRQTLLSVSDSCREMVRSNRAAHRDWVLHALQKSLDADEQAELGRAIELLNRVVES